MDPVEQYLKLLVLHLRCFMRTICILFLNILPVRLQQAGKYAYTARDWKPGIAEHYRLACERIKEGAITDAELDYYTLSVSGMTGETVEEIQASIEEIDPRTIFDENDLKYTKPGILYKGLFRRYSK